MSKLETFNVVDSPLLLSASWDDTEWELFDSWLKDMLKMGPVTVTFTKKDGSERIMECTLQPELLPKVELKEGEEKAPRKKSADVVAVYVDCVPTTDDPLLQEYVPPLVPKTTLSPEQKVNGSPS